MKDLTLCVDLRKHSLKSLDYWLPPVPVRNIVMIHWMYEDHEDWRHSAETSCTNAFIKIVSKYTESIETLKLSRVNITFEDMAQVLDKCNLLDLTLDHVKFDYYGSFNYNCSSSSQQLPAKKLRRVSIICKNVRDLHMFFKYTENLNVYDSVKTFSIDCCNEFFFKNAFKVLLGVFADLEVLEIKCPFLNLYSHKKADTLFDIIADSCRKLKKLKCSQSSLPHAKIFFRDRNIIVERDL
jgi:hypothetical protein